MNFDSYRCISFDRRGKVLVVTLNRPEQLNAVSRELHAELARVFRDVQADPDSEVIVLTGAGRAFSAGGDLAWMQESIDDPGEFERSIREAKEIVFSQAELEKPLICRLNGHAVGLGASLALLCDIVVAHDKVKIGDPHVGVGLVAGDGGALLWPYLVGQARAKKYLFTGDMLAAVEAERIGLISEVVAEDKLDEATYGLAERIAAGAAKAIRWTKVTANLPLRQLLQAHFDAGAAYEMVTNTTRDHQEAVNAFREKRKPVFTGR
ncbi:MAG TPA: enoyl-CoA hydratase-related protein [Ramlibacter sp.]|nr:enoyl-CoA hydratase-related protein [Ramlibacter sp.]